MHRFDENLAYGGIAYECKVRLGALNVVVTDGGKMALDILVTEKCNGIIVEFVVTGFRVESVMPFSQTPLFAQDY